MCMCGKPTVNGEHGYTWNGEQPGIRRPDPPSLREGDELIYDEPGRCGGLDSHSHHVRLVKEDRWSYAILVRNGSGDHRLPFKGSVFRLVAKAGALDAMDSNTRYWFLLSIYNAACDAADEARADERSMWRQAAAQKRIKTRKYRGSDSVKVWIEP